MPKRENFLLTRFCSHEKPLIRRFTTRRNHMDSKMTSIRLIRSMRGRGYSRMCMKRWEMAHSGRRRCLLLRMMSMVGSMIMLVHPKMVFQIPMVSWARQTASTTPASVSAYQPWPSPLGLRKEPSSTNPHQCKCPQTPLALTQLQFLPQLKRYLASMTKCWPIEQNGRLLLMIFCWRGQSQGLTAQPSYLTFLHHSHQTTTGTKTWSSARERSERSSKNASCWILRTHNAEKKSRMCWIMASLWRKWIGSTSKSMLKRRKKSLKRSF